MATYTHPVNPQSFDFPIFEAPTQFLFQVARQKQSLFDQGLRAVGAERRGMATLPVSSQYAIGKRDAYMKEADERLRRIAGADFSLAENRAAASEVYQPMVQDQDLVFDMNQTRYGQKQISHIDRIQYSDDEKERAEYWDTGREYVERSLRKLQSATTAEELRAAKVRTYVPYVDVIGKLNKAAQDLNLKVSIDDVSGDYVVTSVNGDKAVMPFYVFAQSQLGDKERNVFRVLGKVNEERTVERLMLSEGLDETTARGALALQAVEGLRDNYMQQWDSNAAARNRVTAEIDAMLKQNGGKLPENLELRYRSLADKRDLLEQQNVMIDDKLRNIGYNRINGQLIRNDRLETTLKNFAVDLSIPYGEEAQRNYLKNWAMGYATATTEVKTNVDPLFLKKLDVQIQEIKTQGDYYMAQAELSRAQAAAGLAGTTTGSRTGTGRKGSSDEEEVNRDAALAAGLNPFSKQRVSSYNYFSAEKKFYEDSLYTTGVGYVYEATRKDLGLSQKFLTALTENMKKGAGNMSIVGDTRFNLQGEFAEDIKKIDAAAQAGKIPMKNNYLYGDLFKILLTRAHENTTEQLKAAKKPEDVSRLLMLQEEVKQITSRADLLRRDEAKIQKDIISKSQYDLIRTPEGRVISREEYAARALQERGGVRYVRQGQALPNIPGGVSHQSAMVDVLAEPLRKYDKLRKQFDEEFSGYSSRGQLEYLPVSASGEVAATYPFFEFNFYSDGDKGPEKAQLLLKNAFVDQNVTDETRIANLEDLGDAEDVRSVVKHISANIGDMKPEDGRMFYLQVGKDGQNPSVIFRPSAKFLEPFLKKDSPVDRSVINNIMQYGVEINYPISESLVGQHRPSIVSRMLDDDEQYPILPQLKEDGFTGNIIKLPNGQGYQVELSYKTIDPATGEEQIVEDEVQPVIIPEARVDNLSETLVNDILNVYFRYKTSKKAIEDAKARQQALPGMPGMPAGTRIQQRTFTIEELESRRKLGQ